jgi:hypothetical protein
VLLQGSRATAEQLAREVEGIDLIVVGVPVGLERTRLGAPPARIGGDVGRRARRPGADDDARAPADRRQGGRRAAAGDAWTLVPTAARSRRSSRGSTRAWPSSAPIRRPTRRSSQRLEQERVALAASIDKPAPLWIAVAVTLEQAKITCHLAADPGGRRRCTLRRVGGDPEPEALRGREGAAPAKGQAGYVGGEQCEACHAEEAELWATTRHAQAYETLVTVNKQFDLSCVGCHVTGFREPGGAEVVENAKLQDIQCEQCHGPGSLHVAEPQRRASRTRSAGRGGRRVQAVPHAGALRHVRLRGVHARRPRAGHGPEKRDEPR